VGNVDLLALIDTGCSTSVCSGQITELLNIPTTQTVTSTFTTAEGRTQQSTTICHIAILNNDVAFYVIDCIYSFIIGMDFMQRVGATINLKKNILQIGTLSVPLVSAETLSDIRSIQEPTFSIVKHEAVDIPVPEVFDFKQTTTNIQQNIPLLKHYGDVLQEVLPIGHSAKLKPCKIVLIDQKPIQVKGYHNGMRSEEIIQREIEKMLKLKIIEEAESDYNSPILLIPKKDNTIRFCIDYRAINKKTLSQATVLPNIEEQLSRFRGATIFSVIDLTSGYHQLLLDEKSKPITAFCAGGKQYQFLRLPFGLQNAPAIFSSRMAEVIRFSYTTIYLDDILIFSKDKDEHTQHLKSVLDTLRKYNIIAKPSKCQFFKTAVKYLGHDIDATGVKPTKEKIAVLNQLQIPNTIKRLRSILGMFGFYRKFISNYAKRTQKLHQLKEINFWTEEHSKELQDIKKSLEQAILDHPDFKCPFIVYTDASMYSVGGSINQLTKEGVLKPIAFYSRLLTPAELIYNSCEKEALAIVFVVERGRQYLAFNKFEIRTDNIALLQIFKTTHNRRLSSYALRLSEYNFILKHVPGKNNQAADFLSRICTIHQSFELPDNNIIKQYQQVDDEIQQNKDKYIYHNDL